MTTTASTTSPALDTPALDQDPPSLADLDDHPDSRKPASWTRLPVELKQQIVDDVLHAVLTPPSFMVHSLESTLAVTVGFFQRRQARSSNSIGTMSDRRAELKRLQRVDRELHRICTPLLWQNVSAANASDAAVARLAEVLPRHSRDVRTLEVCGARRGRIINFQVTFERIAQDDVVGTWLPECNKLEELVQHSPTAAQLAVTDLPKLVTLVTHSNPPMHHLEKRPFVRQFSTLVSLSLTTTSAFSTPSALGAASIVDLLCDLSNLKHLELADEASISNTTLALADGQGARMPPLESLELAAGRTRLTWPVLREFVSAFSSTLTSLRLVYTQSADIALPPNLELVLPRLSAFAIATDLPSSFFGHLLAPSTPISLFRLDTVPGLRGHVSDLVEFLEAHEETLETVYVSEDAFLDGDGNFILDRNDVDEIFVACDELGVGLTIDDDLLVECEEDGDNEAKYDGWCEECGGESECECDGWA